MCLLINIICILFLHNKYLFSFIYQAWKELHGLKVSESLTGYEHELKVKFQANQPSLSNPIA
jgi:hypothetical protein